MDTVNYRHSLKKTHKKTFGVRGTYSDGAQLAAWAPLSSCNLNFFLQDSILLLLSIKDQITEIVFYVRRYF